LFAIYPVVALAAFNVSEMNLSDSYRSLAISLLVSTTVLIVLNFFFRDWLPSALVTSLLVILFFSYGHVYDLLREARFFGFILFRHRVLGLLWFFLFIFGYRAILNSANNYISLIPTLTIVAVSALLVPTWSILAYQGRAVQIDENSLALREESQALQEIDDGDEYPDIYYIILDGYSRDDYLMDVFEYDNGPFLDWLGEKGFYVAKCSQSNYAQSIFSITSTLNLDYVDSFYDASFDNDYQANRYKQNLISFLKHSRVRDFLEQRGYSTIAFETGDAFSEITDADRYYSLENKSFMQRVFQGVNEFEVLLIRSTGLSFISAVSPAIADRLLPDLDFPNKIHRERILYAFDVLEEIASDPDRKFVFAHIVSPHKPFVFGPEGEVVEWEPGFKVGYPNQINYLNIRVKEVIENILEHSQREPIIIIQGDHGARQFVGEAGRMAILNAYYLPKGGEESVYNTITPVNSFRTIFNEYFGEDFEILEDTSFYSSYLSPLDYSVIQQNGERCQ
jgi:hypothetical protein